MRFARFALLAMLVPGMAVAQPKIDVPAEDPQPAIPRPPALQLQRESQIEVPLSGKPPLSATAIGGYGELVLNAPDNADPAVIDLRRLVLFVGHNFTDRLRLYVELEFEHAVTSSVDKGEAEIEQAFVDYLIVRGINLRAGLLIMPVGIVNQYHEPPTFNGADRPETDTRIIPSTWREVGLGLFGALGPIRYQAYVGTGFDAHSFNAEGIRAGHQEGQLARAHDFGAVARVDYQPVPAFVAGASFYYGRSGQGDRRIGPVPVIMAEADLRLRWKGLEGRAEFVNLWVGNTPELNSLLVGDALFMNPLTRVDPVSGQLRGGYVELGYNVLRPLHTKYETSLVVFGRYERTNTQADVQGSYQVAAGKDRQLLTAGLSLRPIAEVVVKVDYQRITASGGTDDHNNPFVPQSWNQVNAALGFMF